MKDADKAIAELAEQGIVLDAATEAAFRAAWEALPERELPFEAPLEAEKQSVPSKHSRSRKNP